MSNRFELKMNGIFNVLVILIWTQTILLQYVRAVIMRFPVIGGYPDAIISIVYIAVILLALPYCKISIHDLMFVFSVSIVFLLEWIFYKDGREFLDRYMIDFVVKILPLYIVGVSLSASPDKEKIIRQLYILSMVTLAADIFYKFAIGTPMSAAVSQYAGDMNRAYNILPHCCLIAYYAVKKTNIMNVSFTVIGGFYLLMLGTRGAALIYLICIALLLIMGRTSKWAIARMTAIFGAASAFVASPLYDASLLWMYRKAQQFGLSVRIFDKIMSGAVTESSGRDIIRSTLFDSIGKNPVFGYGICSDRVLTGGYAHNIAVELWVEFGIFIGTMILAAIIFVLLRGYLKAESEGEKGLIFSLICASFCKLFLSGSYLDERLLFLLLGMCVYSIRENRQREYKNGKISQIYPKSV